jgi:hypothetical protein
VHSLFRHSTIFGERSNGVRFFETSTVPVSTTARQIRVTA